MFTRVLIVAFVTFLVGCTTQGARAYCVSHPDRCGAHLCSKAHGEIAIAGFSGKRVCNVKSLDVGKACSSAKDCEGRCDLPENVTTPPSKGQVGMCSESVNYFFGCQPPFLTAQGEWAESICED